MHNGFCWIFETIDDSDYTSLWLHYFWIQTCPIFVSSHNIGSQVFFLKSRHIIVSAIVSKLIRDRIVGEFEIFLLFISKYFYLFILNNSMGNKYLTHPSPSNDIYIFCQWKLNIQFFQSKFYGKFFDLIWKITC